MDERIKVCKENEDKLELKGSQVKRKNSQKFLGKLKSNDLVLIKNPSLIESPILDKSPLLIMEKERSHKSFFLNRTKDRQFFKSIEQIKEDTIPEDKSEESIKELKIMKLNNDPFKLFKREIRFLILTKKKFKKLEGNITAKGMQKQFANFFKTS